MMNNYFNGYIPYPNNLNMLSGLRGASLRNTPSLLSSLGLGSKATASIGAGTASKITFGGILNGASKTLGVINQAIPVFYQIKPIWNNAKTMFKVASAVRNSDPTEPSTNNMQTNTTNTVNNTASTNNPSFFI